MSISKLSDKVRLLGASLKNLNPTAIYNKINEIISVVNDIKPYKTYVALLNQSGANPPVPIILENTIGNIVWTKIADGEYEGKLPDGFVVGKTTIICPSNSGPGQTIINDVPDNSTISIVTADTTNAYVDNLLNNTPIEIRVYN